LDRAGIGAAAAVLVTGLPTALYLAAEKKKYDSEAARSALNLRRKPEGDGGA
jgi:hypothetical protein